MANYNDFYGSSLQSISRKQQSGSKIKEFLNQKDYDAIILYAQDELDSFLETFTFLSEYMPRLIRKLKTDPHSGENIEPSGH